MARPGVTYGEVVTAANELVGKGRNPTVEQVRLHIGSGSSTTIANHLRQWKANQEATSLLSTKENIPAELVAVMKGLWEQVLNQSQARIAEVESSYQATIHELQQELDKYKTNNQKWQKLFNQWQQEKATLANEKLTLEQALEFAHKENQSLHGKYDGMLQQLQEKQERVEELARLHQQTQANLEHYRESAREQRLLDQQQFEQQKQQLQTEVKMLNDQSVMQREKMFVAQQQLQLLQQTNTMLNKDNELAKAQIQQLTTRLDDVEKIKDEALHAKKHWQDQYNDLQRALNDKTDQIACIQIEAKIAAQKLLDVTQSIETLESQNKLLVYEKWVLGQEKAQLEGQLKQMQKMISA